MIEFFIDIFTYQHTMNQKLATILEDNETILTDRIQSLYSHSINAQQIWNARILDHDAFSVHEHHPVSEYQSLNDQNYKTSQLIINQGDLDRVIEYKNSKGLVFSNTIQEILFHISNHWTHHRAQIMSDLRQNGLEPFPTDYIFYKR